MSKASQEKLAELHGKVAEKLLKMISSKEATPQDLAQAIKFLKDNNIQADLEFNETMAQLEKRVEATRRNEITKLPFPTKVS